RPSRPALFPYTTLFRSDEPFDVALRVDDERLALGREQVARVPQPLRDEQLELHDDLPADKRIVGTGVRSCVPGPAGFRPRRVDLDRKSTRLNSSHDQIS